MRRRASAFAIIQIFKARETIFIFHCRVEFLRAIKETAGRLLVLKSSISAFGAFHVRARLCYYASGLRQCSDI